MMYNDTIVLYAWYNAYKAGVFTFQDGKIVFDKPESSNEFLLKIKAKGYANRFKTKLKYMGEF